MQPKRAPEQPQRELFQIDLEQLIDMSHALVRLGSAIDWQSFERSLGSTYHPSHGAPGISTRLMVALHYLKYQHDLSDEDVVALWVENPYWQHFSGMRHFQHRMPIDPSSMTRWRKRLGDAGAEQMLRATIEAGMKMRVIRPAEFKRVNVDTTVETRGAELLRTVAEHLSRSLMSLRFVPMRSGSQQCLNVVSWSRFHGDNTGSNPVGDANKESTRYDPFRRNFVGTKMHNFYQALPSFVAPHSLQERPSHDV